MSVRKLTQEFWSLLEKSPPPERRQIITTFINLLAQKRLLSKAHAMVVDLGVWAQEQGKLKPKIISRKENPAVLGGAKIAKGFIVADATVRGRLNILRKVLGSRH